MRRVQVTTAGVYVFLREPGRFFDFRPWPQVPARIQARCQEVCGHAFVDCGRLTAGSPWTVAVVFVPHDALPFGVAEALQVADEMEFAVEGIHA